jgi:hypothetical protein
MIKGAYTQLIKKVVKAMVAVNMNLMPPRVIRRKAYLWIGSFFKLSKDLGLKNCPNT